MNNKQMQAGRLRYTRIRNANDMRNDMRRAFGLPCGRVVTKIVLTMLLYINIIRSLARFTFRAKLYVGYIDELEIIREAARCLD